jgi:hypothetical protein
MFSVPFSSKMSDADIARLTRTLDLVTHLHPKLHNSPVRPGVLRLDFESGLFLMRGANEVEWALQGRTWGDPPPRIVHGWHLRALAAAHQLDPTVTLHRHARRVKEVW